MRKLISAVLLVLIANSQVFGWNDLGHKIIASIAFRQLTRPERDKVVAILAKHPRYDADFKERMPADIATGTIGRRNEWLFQRAAVWPDIARRFEGDLKDQFHRPTWHYINRPHFLNDADRAALAPGVLFNVKLDPPAESLAEMNVVQAIRHARKVLKDDASTTADKALMLSWLFHGVGDLHQPMHSTALVTRRIFREGDRGGNLIVTSKNGNLHALWDNLPGAGDFREARNYAFGIANDDAIVMLGKSAAMELNEEKWLEESHDLAKSTAYSADILAAVRVIDGGQGAEFAPIVVPDDYLKSCGRASDRRLVQAGYRLGAILKTLTASN
jgi:hypothetical protein